MSKKDARLVLRELFEHDAQEILAARNKGLLIHRTDDISQSGQPVEHAVRRVLEARLPTGYHIGHGHVVDNTLKSCGQFDVIISDTLASGLLLKTESGSEYVPIEATYAVGELKSTYDKQSKPFEVFSSRLRELRSLNRPKVSKNFFLIGGKGRGVEFPGTSSDKRPYKNPLFSFMLIADSTKFDVQHVRELYANSEKGLLPNVVCLLDQGVIMYGQFDVQSESTCSFHYLPEFSHLYDEKHNRSRWVFHRDKSDTSRGVHLGWLYVMLAKHLQYCTLQSPDPIEYGKNILADGTSEQERL